MLSTLFIACISLLLGLVNGVFAGYFIPPVHRSLISPLTIENQKKMTKYSLGFLPYWLMDKAKPSYKGTLTHLAYFSLTLNSDGSIQKNSNAREQEPGWTTLHQDRTIKRLQQARTDGLTTSLVLFMSNQHDIADLVATPSAHAQTLLAEVTPIMQEYQFRDLNIDIELAHEVTKAQQVQFTEFIRIIKNGLITHNLGTLTVDVTVSSLLQQHLTDPVAIGNLADHVVLMTYDYHYPGSTIVGPIAPMGGTPDLRSNDIVTSMHKGLEFIPKEKLVLGIPLYGYEWETMQGRLGSAVIPHSGQTASDMRVEQLLFTCTNCTQQRDVIADEPTIIYPENGYFHQIYYTDAQAIAQRLNLTNTASISGVAFWALGYEGNNTLDALAGYRAQ